MARRVIIDTDPGTDDALALLLALRSPALRVEGITTVGGNAALRHTTANALALLERFGAREVPLARGAARPLKGHYEHAYHFHGSQGLTLHLPRAMAEPVGLRAPDFLISQSLSWGDVSRTLVPNRHIMAKPGASIVDMGQGLTLVGLGPLINIAHAIRRESRLPQMLQGLVVMGGALGVPGNVSRYAEFNIFNDPEAAQEVLNCGAPVTLVPLDVCQQVYLTPEDVPAFRRGDEALRLMGRMLENWFGSHSGRERYLLCDPLAVAAAIDPTILRTRPCTVKVLTDGPQRGRTVASKGQGSVHAALEVDVRSFYRLFFSTLGLETTPSALRDG